MCAVAVMSSGLEDRNAVDVLKAASPHSRPLLLD